MIYVDSLFCSLAFGHKYWCHMTADTIEELHEFAHKIGLKVEWFQEKGKHCSHNHYDLTSGKRKMAVRYGAKELTVKEYCKVANGYLKERTND